jgi:hypothetical protein
VRLVLLQVSASTIVEASFSGRKPKSPAKNSRPETEAKRRMKKWEAKKVNYLDRKHDPK